MKSKEYIRPIPATWWMHNHYLVLFMIRELTSLFVAGYAVFLLVALSKATQGKEAFISFFTAVQSSPGCIALQIVSLLFVCYHSITWFNLTPKALVVWNGDEKVNPVLVAGANYVVWLIVSVILVFLVRA